MLILFLLLNHALGRLNKYLNSVNFFYLFQINNIQFAFVLTLYFILNNALCRLLIFKGGASGKGGSQTSEGIFHDNSG